MPLKGGASDKFGIRYEGRWTVFNMADVMDERADTIRLEPPAVEDEGAEFWVRRGSLLVYHQVKRQYGTEGRWTIGSLKGRGVFGEADRPIQRLRLYFNSRRISARRGSARIWSIS